MVVGDGRFILGDDRWRRVILGCGEWWWLNFGWWWMVVSGGAVCNSSFSDTFHL